VKMINASPDYQSFKRGDAYMVTLGRSMRAQVMWNSGGTLPPTRLRVPPLLGDPEAYGHQTGILLERI
jgi:hypothetical protein